MYLIKPTVLFSALAMGLTFFGFLPYIQSILKNKTQPHVFSWVIWGVTTLTVGFAQYADGAGVGAWPIWLSGIITFYIAYLAYLKKGDHHITVTDTLFFSIALLSLPLWYLTSDPLWAVVILTTIDIIGFFPTFRKAYHDPKSEPIGFYSLMTIRNLFAIVALEHFSLTTLLFPVLTGLFCIGLILMIWLRNTHKNKL